MYWTDFSKGVCTIIGQVMDDEMEDNIIFDTPHISVKDSLFTEPVGKTSLETKYI